MNIRPIERLGKEAIEEAGERLALHSNDSINKAFQVMANGAIDAWNFGANSLAEKSIQKGFEQTFKGNNGWEIGRIAASGLMVSAGARVLSGGGLTRDANGSQDIIGIPFI